MRGLSSLSYSHRHRVVKVSADTSQTRRMPIAAASDRSLKQLDARTHRVCLCLLFLQRSQACARDDGENKGVRRENEKCSQTLPLVRNSDEQ